MTHPNSVTNGASLEDCHTNFFALVSRNFWVNGDLQLNLFHFSTSMCVCVCIIFNYLFGSICVCIVYWVFVDERLSFRSNLFPNCNLAFMCLSLSSMCVVYVCTRHEHLTCFTVLITFFVWTCRPIYAALNGDVWQRIIHFYHQTILWIPWKILC